MTCKAGHKKQWPQWDIRSHELPCMECDSLKATMPEAAQAKGMATANTEVGQKDSPSCSLRVAMVLSILTFILFAFSN